MHHRFTTAIAAFLLAPLAATGLCLSSEPQKFTEAAQGSPFVPEKAEQPVCSAHGTKIDFLATPKEAATLAKKEQKLVFVLHVSGNFEDPRFT